MIPFLVAEALRRVRRVDRRRPPRPGVPMWRLLAGELRYQFAARVLAPRGAAAMCGMVAAVGVWVALGPVYPGPVAPAVVRWLLAGAVAFAALGLARTVPARWGEVRRAVRRARVGLAVVAAAGAVSVVKVGLHEVTPGPVVSGPARWGVVAVVVVVAALVSVGPGSSQDG